MAVWNGTTGAWQSLLLDNFTLSSSAQGVACFNNGTALIVAYLILGNEFTTIGIAVLNDESIQQFTSPEVNSVPGVRGHVI